MKNPDAARIRLYELVLQNGRSSSPYVWRIRYALAHKGLSFDSVPLGFTEIATVLKGRSKTVPVIEHDGTMVADSWDIAEYLDRAFPQLPALFSSPAENAMVRLFDAWQLWEIMRKLFRIYVLDIHNAARPEDRCARNSRAPLSWAAARRITPTISLSAIFTGSRASRRCRCWRRTTRCARGSSADSSCTAASAAIRG
jgi:glutathione S-transferase